MIRFKIKFQMCSMFNVHYIHIRVVFENKKEYKIFKTKHTFYIAYEYILCY